MDEGGRYGSNPGKKVDVQLGIKQFLELQGPEKEGSTTTKPQIGAGGALGKFGSRSGTSRAPKTVPLEGGRKEAVRKGKGRTARPLEKWLLQRKDLPGGLGMTRDTAGGTKDPLA